MKKIKLKNSILILLVVLGFSNNIFSAGTTLKWATYGAPLPQVFSNQNFSYCGADPVKNLQVHFDCQTCGSSLCLNNRYEYTVDLYKNGVKISTKTVNDQTGSVDVYWNIYTMGAGIYRAGVTSRIKDFGCLTYSTLQSDVMSNTITVTQIPPTPNFNIDGGSTPDGSTVTSCISKIKINASSTSCETAYYLGVEECDQYWSVTNAYTFGVWFAGQAPDNISLQNMASTYSYPPYFTGLASRQGNILLGGNLPNGATRYYRVKICTGPIWACKTVLLRVDETCKLAPGTEDTNIYTVLNYDPKSQTSPEGTITSIKDIINLNDQIVIAPNPSNGLFTINLPSDEKTKIEVYDMKGVNVISTESTSDKYQINLSEQPKGIYIVNITTPSNRYSKKIIVE